MNLKGTAENLLLVFSGLVLIYEFINNFNTQCLDKRSILLSIFAISYALLLRRF